MSRDGPSWIRSSPFFPKLKGVFIQLMHPLTSTCLQLFASQFLGLPGCPWSRGFNFCKATFHAEAEAQALGGGTVAGEILAPGLKIWVPKHPGSNRIYWNTTESKIWMIWNDIHTSMNEKHLWESITVMMALDSLVILRLSRIIRIQ